MRSKLTKIWYFSSLGSDFVNVKLRTAIQANMFVNEL